MTFGFTSLLHFSRFRFSRSTAAIVLVFATAAGAQREIVVDASKVIGPHSTTPLMTIGAGRANEGLRADWQEELSMLQKDVGFKYLRFHGLLDDDMGVYMEDVNGDPIYNFQYVDRLYDAMLALHIRPFVELGFMPQKLASGTQTVFWYKANVTPPREMAKWNGLIRALIQHWQERYGDAEITQWYYEVWNEPDLNHFWSGTQQQYFDLYRNTVETIKAVCPQCRVGGPAAQNPEIEGAWLTYIAQQHLPADFESAHAYGSVIGVDGNIDATGHTTTTLFNSPNTIVSRVQSSRDRLNKSANPTLELHYTEWSSSYASTDPFHDQYYSTAFILDRLRKTSSLAQSMSYWTFTDIFEENGPRPTPFYGGFGLINYQGIRKPAYFAYRFLAQLDTQDIATNDAQSWTTRSSDGSVQILFWNYTLVVPPGKESDQTFFKSEQPAKLAGITTLKVSGLHEGQYTLNIYRAGYQKNDAYTAYLKLSSPDHLTPGQVNTLKAASTGDPTETREIVIKNGDFTSPFEMHENDSVLVTLKRRH